MVTVKVSSVRYLYRHQDSTRVLLHRFLPEPDDVYCDVHGYHALGKRTRFAQNVSDNTSLIGAQQQEYQLGQLLRSIYLNSSSDSVISGMNATLADQKQIKSMACLHIWSLVTYIAGPISPRRWWWRGRRHLQLGCELDAGFVPRLVRLLDDACEREHD